MLSRRSGEETTTLENMKMNHSRALRCSAITLGAVLLLSAGTAVASAAEESFGDDTIDVTVDITTLDEPGVLAMTVEAATAGLTEDGGPGLVDQELLFLGESAEAADSGGIWSATAGLQLRVGADVAPGSYTSVLTLSLFE